jgi:hypothetical protein
VRRILFGLLVAIGRPRQHRCWTGAMPTSEKSPSTRVNRGKDHSLEDTPCASVL